MSTVNDLLAQRANVIEQARSMLRDANAAGEVLSGEAREQLERYEADAEALKTRADQMQHEAELDARAAADADALATAQQVFTASPTQRAADAATDADASEGNAFASWLRGDMSVFGGVREATQ